MIIKNEGFKLCISSHGNALSGALGARGLISSDLFQLCMNPRSMKCSNGSQHVRQIIGEGIAIHISIFRKLDNVFSRLAM